MTPDTTLESSAEFQFVCPACRGSLKTHDESYECASCNRHFPVLFGIPDFRLRSDRYLSLEQERLKATRLAQSGLDFAAMLDLYYDITDDVPPELAQVYKSYHQNGPMQASHSIHQLALSTQDYYLDAGCGTGGSLLAAADSGARLVGVDIALRWLVIAKQRLQEQGIDATLVCADIESPPFKNGQFSKIAATDLLENVYDVNRSLQVLSALLDTKGRLWLAGCNQYCIGPHPSTRLWAIGYLPGPLRKRVTTFFRGVDSLRYINLIDPCSLIKAGRKLRLDLAFVAPKKVATHQLDSYPKLDQILIRLYAWLAIKPLVKQLLILIGPAFEMILFKTEGEPNRNPLFHKDTQ
ncbi:MAG: hypothetical protein CMK83_07715 [Pseudomonadales bacterium]|nr:hypothetical protein [Pseudomonadales bacterium]TNC88414.1 MAG: hypothetical protein CSH49_11630 [Alcanivorax sp.]HAU12545.1 hypothetical protein [Gammaproteobacteria bacterium]